MKSKKFAIALLSLVVIPFYGLVFAKDSVSSDTAFKNENFLQNIQNILKGNNTKYSLKNVKYNSRSQLKNKKIIFLGSSITYGFGSFGQGVPELLKKADGIVPYKYAVTGTTMGGRSRLTFVNRMKNDIPKRLKPDLFVVQLSTNDKRFHIPEGKISQSKSLNSFDTDTTIGATEYIIKCAKTVWQVPVVFFTVLNPEDNDYGKQIQTLYILQKKWQIGIINLGQDKNINAKTARHSEYMADDVHPTREGYQKLWLPYFEKKLPAYLNK